MVDCALGNQPGSAKLYVDAQNDAIGSLVGFSEEYRQAYPLAVVEHSVECRVTTLDDLCVAEGIKRIDLLKVDVEGFEFEVLQGARRMLPNTQAIVVELSLIRRAPGGKDGLLEMLLLSAQLRLRNRQCDSITLCFCGTVETSGVQSPPNRPPRKELARPTQLATTLRMTT